jgi:hypothetical protein
METAVPARHSCRGRVRHRLSSGYFFSIGRPLGDRTYQ